MNPPEFPHDASGAGSRLVDAIFSRLLQGEPLERFCDWFAGPEGPLAAGMVPGLDADPRAARALARGLWGAVPMPGNRWRPRGLPKVERNDPCHCGSGRKYKQCCAAWAGLPLPMEPDMLTVLAIQHAPPEALAPASVRALAPHALAQAAMLWLEQGQPEQAERVLAPLFEPGGPELDERHEVVFDVLMDALQALGQHTRRLALARQVGHSRDKVLAIAARGREIGMLADAGNFSEAWAAFKQAQHIAPDEPQLLHLELIILLNEGRADEARLRAPLLAARARRAGLDELAQVLLGLGERGLQAAYDDLDDAEPGDDDAGERARAWLDLCAQAPAELDVEATRALYHIDTQGPPRRAARRPADTSGQSASEALTAGMGWLRVRPARTLLAIERRWQRRFPVGKPQLTGLIGEADVLIDDAIWAQEFLRISPLGWLSVQVLDDVLLAAQERLLEDDGAAERQAAWRLAEHALRVLRALWQQAGDAASARQAKLGAEWAHPGTQPLLRLLAQIIDLGQTVGHDVLALQEWALALNPNDNQGWREELAEAYCAAQRPGDALAVLDAYPNDFPPAAHRRALALYMLGRQDEAAAVLAEAHADAPAFMPALWPEVLDAPAPPDGPGILVGGEHAAYAYRANARAVWVRSGALAWSQGLGLRVVPAKKTRKKQTAAAAPRTSGAPRTEDLSLPAEARRHLQRHYDWPRLHGLLSGIAWSPDLLMPGRWVPLALALRSKPPPKTQAAQLKAANTDLTAIMQLYNSLNAPLAVAQAGAPMPLLALAQELAPQGKGDAPEQALHAWAAGFVQAAELSAAAWRRAGRPVQAVPARKAGASAFSTLYALAARAPHVSGDEGDGEGKGDSPAWQALRDDGQPLLTGLDAEAALPAAAAGQIQAALSDLWQVVLPVRLARQHDAAAGTVQIDHFSLD